MIAYHLRARIENDRGTTLIEVVTALALTLLAAGALVAFASGSARTVERVSADDPNAPVAADALSRDLRRAQAGAVIALNGKFVTEIEIQTATTTVRWKGAGGAVTRQVLPDGVARTVVDGLHPTQPFEISLFTSDGTAVDHTDATKVHACTRLVEFTLVGTDGQPVHQRSISMRAFIKEPDTC